MNKRKRKGKKEPRGCAIRYIKYIEGSICEMIPMYNEQLIVGSSLKENFRRKL